MKVVIVGAGEVGYHIALFLSLEKIDVVVIDSNRDNLKRVSNDLDVATIEGHGGSPAVLKEAGLDGADILLAVTNSDETNMIACLIGKALFKVKRKIARIRDAEYLNNAVLLNKYNLDIDPAISPELESARAIIRLVGVPLASVVEDFEDGIVKVVGYKIPSGSYLVGDSLKDLNKKTGFRFLIGIILRDNTIIIPSGKDRLKDGDIIYFPVLKGKIEETMSFIIGSRVKPARNVMIVGGGRVGFHVALMLEVQGINVKIIEKDADRCKFLSKTLKNAVILHGDGTDRTLLEEENMEDMEVFAALSQNEELNIMASVLAKRGGVRRVITLVNRTDYISLANSLGIESVLSPRLITASSILRYVRMGEILSLTAIAEDRAEILEAGVKDGAILGGLKLKDTRLPKGALIGAIIRGDNVIIPSGEDIIHEGDRIIVFALRQAISEVEKLI